MRVKRALVAVTWELFKLVSPQPGAIIECTDNDIPADAKVVNASYDFLKDQLVLCLESESFPETEVGCVLPSLNGPSFKSYTRL